MDYRPGTEHPAQVFIHAVPVAEVDSMPGYCEYTVGSGWDCVPADNFTWTGYAFTGVRRTDTYGVDHWFPSPVGPYEQPYTSQTHTFNDTPRWTDPQYVYPDEYTHVYFALPGVSLPDCPPGKTCIFYEDRAPGVERLEFDLYGYGEWGITQTHAYTIAVTYPITITKSRIVYTPD
jgi:hypothetical protein